MDMDYEQAASYWEKQDAAAKKMDRDTLAARAEEFLAAHNTCALATGHGTHVRCTPIEYTYRQGCFWLLSEGGEKFRNLKENDNVCLAVYDGYKGFGTLAGMQVTGKAQLIEPWSEPYRDLLRWKKIPEAALRGLDHPMYLIRVTPVHIDFLHSDFKKLGFSTRQQLDF
jgi:general stress protein 26